MIDPDFDADDPEGRMRLGETVINIGPQCLERNATFDLLLRASDLSAAQAPADDHLDALRAAAHGLLNRLLHSPAKGDALLDLLSDPVSDQNGVYLGITNLQNGETNLFRCIIFFRHSFERLAQAFYTLTTLADHDARLRGMNGNADLGAGNALNLDA
jgi:hypothetical protein